MIERNDRKPNNVLFIYFYILSFTLLPHNRVMGHTGTHKCTAQKLVYNWEARQRRMTVNLQNKNARWYIIHRSTYTQPNTHRDRYARIHILICIAIHFSWITLIGLYNGVYRVQSVQPYVCYTRTTRMSVHNAIVARKQTRFHGNDDDMYVDHTIHIYALHTTHRTHTHTHTVVVVKWCQHSASLWPICSMTHTHHIHTRNTHVRLASPSCGVWFYYRCMCMRIALHAVVFGTIHNLHDSLEPYCVCLCANAPYRVCMCIFALRSSFQFRGSIIHMLCIGPTA